MPGLHPLELAPRRSFRPRPELAKATAQLVLHQAKRWLELRPDDVVLGITFQPNREFGSAYDAELSDAREIGVIERFAAHIDRNHLGYGERFRKMKKKRPRYALVGQVGTGGYHYHGIVCVPPEKAAIFQAQVPRLWKLFTHTGSLVLDADLDSGWLSYITRHLSSPQAAVAYVIPGPG